MDTWLQLRMLAALAEEILARVAALEARVAAAEQQVAQMWGQ